MHPERCNPWKFVSHVSLSWTCRHPKRQQRRRRCATGKLLVSLSSPPPCTIHTTPLLSARKTGPSRRASESPPTPKLLRLPEVKLLLCPISYKKLCPAFTGGPTSTQARNIPSAPKPAVWLAPRGSRSLKSHADATMHDFWTHSLYIVYVSKPGNFSDDYAELMLSCTCPAGLPWCRARRDVAGP